MFRERVSSIRSHVLGKRTLYTEYRCTNEKILIVVVECSALERPDVLKRVERRRESAAGKRQGTCGAFTSFVPSQLHLQLKAAETSTMED